MEIVKWCFAQCIAILVLCLTIYTVLMFSVTLSFQEFGSSPLNHEVAEPASRDPIYTFVAGVLFNLLLIALFVFQHSFMATSFWKTKIVTCTGFQRSGYVLATNISILLMIHFWHQIQVPSLWIIDTSDSFFLWLFFGMVHMICWILIYGANLCTDLPELLGFTEMSAFIGEIHYTPLSNKSKEMSLLLRHMRHPGSFCLLVVLWCHPIMTWSRFILACALTIYILCGFSVTDNDYYYTKRSWIKKTYYEEYAVYESLHTD